MTDSEFYRSLLRAYIDSANDGIFVLCDEMKFHVANNLFQSWLGVSEDRLTEHGFRRPITDYIGNEKSQQRFIEHFNFALTGRPSRFECLLHSPGANARWIEISLSKVNLEAGEMFIGVARDITEKKENESLIWRQANYDFLTGLANRHLFQDRLEQEIKKAQRARLPLALMVIDLDHFKEVNDTLGHDMGDCLLKEAALRLDCCVREADIVARLGGDEFAVILGSLSETECLERISQNILQVLAEPFRLRDQVVYLSSSIGITFYPQDASSVEDMLKEADQAMYAAKQQGRNRCCYYSPTMQEAMQQRMRLVNDLRAAVVVPDDAFFLLYQPVVNLASGGIHKAEALIRWRHPTRGIVNPTEFIPVAEDTEMILQIGDWVFHEALRQVTRWRLLYHPEFQISVNISPVQIRHASHAYDWVDYLQKVDLPGQSIMMEITEGLLLDANRVVVAKLLAFHEAGMQVAIDDFGTGYSSFSYLKKFNIDTIKIDQSFVSSLTANSGDMALCEAMIAMAHKLGIKVIAEGVETAVQRDLLIAAGCDYGQGYLFSRPMPVEQWDSYFTAYCGSLQ